MASQSLTVAAVNTKRRCNIAQGRTNSDHLLGLRESGRGSDADIVVVVVVVVEEKKESWQSSDDVRKTNA